MDWSPRGDALVTGSFHKHVGLWKVVSEQPFQLSLVCLWREHESLVNGVRFSPCGTCVAAASNNGTVRVWSVDTLEPLHVLDGQDGIEWAVAFEPEGRLMATAGSDQIIRIRDWRGERIEREWPAHESEIWTLDYDSTGRFLGSGSLDGSVAIWWAANRELVPAPDPRPRRPSPEHGCGPRGQ